MIPILFLSYLYFLGLIFGLCFKKWIPVKFIVLSGFLWGSILYALTFYFLYMTGLIIDIKMFLIILAAVFILIFISLLRTWDKGIKKDEWITILFVVINFTLLNLIYSEFDYSRASGDSYIYLNLARSIGFDGFNNSVIQTLLSYGGLIPILHSSSIHLGYDYLVSLQFSFGISFIAVFCYFCEKACFNLIQNHLISKIITLFATLVMISAPMIIYQLFFVHTNLTAGFFLFLGAICGWLAIKENNNAYFVFFTLSLIGANLSRTETFLYSIIVIFLLLFSNKLTFKQRIIGFFPILAAQTVWFIYLYLRISENLAIQPPQATDLMDYSTLLNPVKLLTLAMLMFAIFVIILLSRLDFISLKVFPFVNKHIISISLASLFLFILIQPSHMISSIRSFITNLFLGGSWGFAYWLILIILIVKLFEAKTSFESFLINALVCIPTIIIDLSFFRPPFHLGWGDSANRLMTFGIPFGSLLLAITICKWYMSKYPNVEKIENSNLV
jgi:hypothetical protein